MGSKGPVKKIARGALAAGVAAVPAVVATAQPAAANTIAPPGCAECAFGDWGPNCWVGPSYSTDSNYVLAVQFLTRGYGHDPGPTDCKYGAQTAQAVAATQVQFGLSPDGIVGPASWNKFQDKLALDHVEAGVFYYYDAGTEDKRFKKFAGTGGWDVRQTFFGVNWHTMNAQDASGCHL